MELGLKNKQALVTASSEGIGRGIASSLAREGAKVSIAARNVEKLERTHQEIGALHFFPADISAADGVTVLIESYERILVINTAGPPKGGV
jgi:3-oxoacyl-[acyl-carrier protein] reductase